MSERVFVSLKDTICAFPWNGSAARVFSYRDEFRELKLHGKGRGGH